MTSPPKRQPIPFGKYLLLDRINIGGMAEVWRGKMFGAGGFERLVAIKRILPNIAEDEEFISMFIDEAKITVQLNHANIAQVYELGHVGSSYFIAMEYIPGKDMRAIFDRSRKRGEPPPIPFTCYVVSKLCEGLDYAHRKKDAVGRDMNVVHRDISPQNVLLSYEGEVKVIDFGIAKAANKATKTQAGILKGKFAYMSPEQIRGLPLDRRSDIFAIGICLYEMLTGERLFVGDSDFSVLEKVRKAEVLPPSTYNRRIPDTLEKIVLKALAKDVDDRYQYASDLAEDLQRFLITSDSMFGRNDLVRYMKSTFAEDVEREKLRLQEYAEVKPPESMLASLEKGYSPQVPAITATAVPVSPSVPEIPALSPNAEAIAGTLISTPAGGRKPVSVTDAIPQLRTAAPPAPQGLPQETEGSDTILMQREEYMDVVNADTDGAGSPALPPPVITPQPMMVTDGVGAQATVLMGEGAPNARNDTRTPSDPSYPAASNAEDTRRMPPPAPPVVSGPHRRVSKGAEARRLYTAPTGLPADSSPSVQTVPGRPSAQELEEPTLTPTVSPLDQAKQLWRRLSRNQQYGVIGAAGFLVLLLGWMIFRAPAEGLLLINLPTDLSGKVKVSINGKDLEPQSEVRFPLVRRVEAGPTMVTMSADGYETYSGTVMVEEGDRVTALGAEFRPLKSQVNLTISLSPDDAEVRIDDEVVKHAEDKSRVYAGELPLGRASLIEVRARGYRPYEKKVTPSDPKKNVDLDVTLKPLDFVLQVGSDPDGAEVLVDGRPMGTTPANIRVSGAVREVTLRRHCFVDAVLPVHLPDQGNDPIVLNQPLERDPGCH